MNEKEKQPKNFLVKWYETRLQKNPLYNWYIGNYRAILSRLRYRILFIVLDSLLVLFILYLLSYTMEYNRAYGLELYGQMVVLILFAFFLVFPILYAYRSFMQIVSEHALNNSLFSIRKEIVSVRKQKKDFRALQAKINGLRTNLKDFIDFSAVISPPIYDYEMNRLHKGIDIFFNATSEVLFDKPNIFSRAQKLERQHAQLSFQRVEHPTEEEQLEQYEEMERGELGIIDWFGLNALDEFLQYLGDVLFSHSETYSPFSYKHPIDLITLSRFFNDWNSVVSRCSNCREKYGKSKKDIDEYYKALGESKSLRTQRVQKLMDSLIVIVISVVLSTLVSYLIGL